MPDDPTWLAVAKTLPAGRRIRIECCASDKSMLVSNEARGFRAYCFRCGPRGFVAHGDFSIDQLQRRREEQAWLSDNKVRLPNDFTTDIPTADATWLYRAGLSARICKHYGFGYSAKLKRVVLPVYADGTLIGFTARSTIGAKPKYIERMADPSGAIFAADPAVALPTSGASTQDHRPDLVFTEDILSAVRVGRHVPRCVSLMGTSASDGQLHRATKGTETRAAVWLDNDRAGRKYASVLVRKLRLRGMDVRRIRTAKDPKFYSNREIREILNE